MRLFNWFRRPAPVPEFVAVDLPPAPVVIEVKAPVEEEAEIPVFTRWFFWRHPPVWQRNSGAQVATPVEFMLAGLEPDFAPFREMCEEDIYPDRPYFIWSRRQAVEGDL